MKGKWQKIIYIVYKKESKIANKLRKRLMQFNKNMISEIVSKVDELKFHFTSVVCSSLDLKLDQFPKFTNFHSPSIPNPLGKSDSVPRYDI